MLITNLIPADPMDMGEKMASAGAGGGAGCHWVAKSTTAMLVEAQPLTYNPH